MVRLFFYKKVPGNVYNIHVARLLLINDDRGRVAALNARQIPKELIFPFFLYFLSLLLLFLDLPDGTDACGTDELVTACTSSTPL
jgi:hypothetical protein